MNESPGTGGPIDHEIDARGIVKVAGWLTVVTVVAFLAAWGFYRALERGERGLDPPPSPLAEANRTAVPPGPGLQATPEKELAALRAAEQRRLDGWGWVDRAAGVAHVPVDVAIDRVAAEGALPSLAAPAEVGSP